MMNENKFNEVLEKYQLKEPLPIPVQKHLMEYKRNNLYTIMKDQSRFAVITAIAVSLYFKGKSFGVSVPLSKMLLAVTAAGVIAAASVITGAALIAKPYVTSFISAKKSVSVENAVIPEQIPIITPATKPLQQIQYTLQIMPFKCDPDSKMLSKQLSNNIAARINGIKGGKFAGLSRTNSVLQKSGKALFGSVYKTGGEYLVTVKIIDENTKILFLENRTIISAAEIDALAADIAPKIIGCLR